MKSTLLILIVSFITIGFQAQAEETQWPQITLSSYVADKYIGFSTGNVLSKDPVIQSGLHASFKNGFYTEIYNSRSLKGSWNDGSLGNEMDYGFGWKGNLATNLSLKLGALYYDEPNAFTLGAGDVLQSYVFLTRDFKHLSVIAGFENFVTMPGSGFQGGNLVSLGVSKYQLLCKGKLGLRASAALVYDTATLGSGEGFILRGSAGADWNITKHLTFNIVGVNWYSPLTPKDRRETDAMWSSGFTFRFR